MQENAFENIGHIVSASITKHVSNCSSIMIQKMQIRYCYIVVHTEATILEFLLIKFLYIHIAAFVQIDPVQLFPDHGPVLVTS